MLRVPGSSTDLFRVKSAGGDVRIVYSPLDAVRLAQAEPRQAGGVLRDRLRDDGARERDDRDDGQAAGPHQLLAARLARARAAGDHARSWSRRPAACRRFLAAGHVCTVMGMREYDPLVEEYHVPIVVTGFEPLDVLEGIRRALVQLEEGRAELENAYPRAVSSGGQRDAQAVRARRVRGATAPGAASGRSPRRGGGSPTSTPTSTPSMRFDVTGITTEESSLCRPRRGAAGPDQAERVRGVRQECTPRTPLGAPMVSSEGACAAYYQFRSPLEPPTVGA